jgi:hypothetical protein
MRLCAENTQRGSDGPLVPSPSHSPTQGLYGTRVGRIDLAHMRALQTAGVFRARLRLPRPDGCVRHARHHRPAAPGAPRKGAGHHNCTSTGRKAMGRACNRAPHGSVGSTPHPVTGAGHPQGGRHAAPTHRGHPQGAHTLHAPAGGHPAPPLVVTRTCMHSN